MKFRTTKKEVTNGYGIVLKIGYCNAQNLLQYQNERAYTCGSYGWNADIYEIEPFNGTAIVTGYRPFGTATDYETLKEYETKAEKINYDRTLDYEERKTRVNSLLVDFIRAEVKRIRGI